MSVLIMAKDGIVEVPTRGGGNLELLERLSALEAKADQIVPVLEGKLDTNNVTMSTAVTQYGYAVDARQMNPTIDGTLANDMELSRENSKNKFYIYQKHLQMSDFEPRGVFVASYWDSGHKEDNFQNLTDTMPAPFNDRNNVVVIGASTENREYWGAPAPVTAWSKSSATVFKPGVDWNNLYLSIALMRTDI